MTDVVAGSMGIAPGSWRGMEGRGESIAVPSGLIPVGRILPGLPAAGAGMR